MTRPESSDLDARLRAALEENERLRERLGAVRHSLGNHLALLSAVLARQSRVCEYAEARDALAAAQSRIGAIAEALRAAMVEPDAEDVLVGEPVARLVDEFRAHAGSRVAVSLDLDVPAIRADDAVSYLLLLNELATNALQHAFPGGLDGELRIAFRREGASLALTVEDNGVGRAASASDRLGGKIVAGAVRGLRATLTETAARADTARPGFRVVVSAPTRT